MPWHFISYYSACISYFGITIYNHKLLMAKVLLRVWRIFSPNVLMDEVLVISLVVFSCKNSYVLKQLENTHLAMLAVNGIVSDDLKREIEPPAALKIKVICKLLVLLICTKILTT